MSLAQILNLSKPRLVAAVAIGCVALVATSIQILRYHPDVRDACAGIAAPPATPAEAPFNAVADEYLRRTRDWAPGDYCVDRIWTKGAERVVSVRRRGMLVGGGEGFQVRIDPVRMTVTGELSHD